MHFNSKIRRYQDFSNGDPLCLYWFHQFMELNSVTPSQVGCSNGWVGCGLINRSDATTLPMRRRLYWSLRFPSWYEARSCECRVHSTSCLCSPQFLQRWQKSHSCLFYRAQCYCSHAEGLHSQCHYICELEQLGWSILHAIRQYKISKCCHRRTRLVRIWKGASHATA